MAAMFEPIGKAVCQNNRYSIVLNGELKNAVMGLEEFSHIQVVWWFHLTDNTDAHNALVMDKPYRNGPEKIGILATRGPIRPNPIAISVCELLAVDKQTGRIDVAYLDAADGTPILDIKPYHPSSDRIRDVRMPAWCAHWPAWYEDSGTFDWGAEFNFPS